MLRPCIVWQLIKVLAEMLSQGGRYLNLKNGKEAIEVTEGKSNRMRWVTLRTFMILWFIEESFWLQYEISISTFNTSFQQAPTLKSGRHAGLQPTVH